MVTDNASADRGSFTYISAANFTGNDTFTYTIRDKGLDGVAGNADDLISVGTATITVANQVWYVDNTAGPGGDGTSTNPFDSLADVSGATGPDTAGDVIYINTGSGDYTGGITLLNNQTWSVRVRRWSSAAPRWQPPAPTRPSPTRQAAASRSRAATRSPASRSATPPVSTSPTR